MNPLRDYSNVCFVKSWSTSHGNTRVPYRVQNIWINKDNKIIRLSPGQERQIIPKGYKLSRLVTVQEASCVGDKCNACGTQKMTEKDYVIEWDDYQGIPCSPDHYQEKKGTTEIIDLSKYKLERNMEFCNFLRDYPRANRKVVVLDSPTALSAKMLSTLGIGPKNIIVPNLDSDFLQKCPTFNSVGTFVHTSLFEYFRDCPEDVRGQADIGADLCCTPQGNKYVKALSDLSLMFQRAILAKENGVLWVTLSYRTSGTVESQKQDFLRFINNESLINGYHLRLLKSGHYPGIMYFFFVSVANDTKPKPKTSPSPTTKMDHYRQTFEQCLQKFKTNHTRTRQSSTHMRLVRWLYVNDGFQSDITESDICRSFGKFGLQKIKRYYTNWDGTHHFQILIPTPREAVYTANPIFVPFWKQLLQ